jgi:hypothetical protein
MAIQLEWANDDRSILMFRHLDALTTWKTHHRALRRGWWIARNTHRPIVTIHDARRVRLPDGPSQVYIRRAMRHIPANVIGVIPVIHDKAVIYALEPLFKPGADHRIRIADSLRDALAHAQDLIDYEWDEES